MSSWRVWYLTIWNEIANGIISEELDIETNLKKIVNVLITTVFLKFIFISNDF
jgi:hypothetical protein